MVPGPRTAALHIDCIETENIHATTLQLHVLLCDMVDSTYNTIQNKKSMAIL
jgi:hypothetical protein